MKTSAWTLWLSAFGGCAAWTAALLIVPTLGSVNCAAPLSHTARFGGTWWILTALNAAALAAACYALWINVRVLRGVSSGSSDESRRDRTHFMAFGGLFLNLGFIVSLAFFGVGLFLVPVCQ